MNIFLLNVLYTLYYTHLGKSWVSVFVRATSYSKAFLKDISVNITCQHNSTPTQYRKHVLLFYRPTGSLSPANASEAA